MTTAVLLKTMPTKAVVSLSSHPVTAILTNKTGKLPVATITNKRDKPPECSASVVWQEVRTGIRLASVHTSVCISLLHSHSSIFVDTYIVDTSAGANCKFPYKLSFKLA